ncbi:BofC C-terminal domain-containing protein [Thalassobacillus hwangdonensis]|uniref:BofC C-terminal domain-containing protein n=1 Tax=Thalassobacillus hwangdonensis TaxID=546108 RepID=A0ABW3KZB2_9BACI
MRPLRYTLTFLLVIGCLIYTRPQDLINVNADDRAAPVASEPMELTVKEKTTYIDGTSEVDETVQTIWSMEDFWAQYRDWQFVEMGEGFVTFEKASTDISPSVKKDGYFGIDLNNQLSIFRGKPANGDVIESFYSIPVEKLESSRMKALKEGIKITDKEQFQHVMETYAEFSGEKEKY